ncbi:MAG: DUF1684 domain-containing protein [Flavobacteriales bacterium]|nr:DUF1684 domain-containing protein [Flavobacteriales bacterium]MCB9193554.1 DUF1684 domain-containing protein [Flavobacteriales bacterium]
MAGALLLAVGALDAQVPDRWAQDLQAYWDTLEAEFHDPAESPLGPEERAHFTHIDRFPADSAYVVHAGFQKADEPREFPMRTTTDRAPRYRLYGVLRFTLQGKSEQLEVYQSMDLLDDPKYANYLFVPFTDPTNGEETYGGGRYMDLEGPLGPEVVLDLNRAYNPYCAYAHRFSCPRPPSANTLDVPVLAGARKFHD